MNIEKGGLNYQKLKQKEEKVQVLEQEVKTKTKKLKTYRILPPVKIQFFFFFLILNHWNKI